MRLSLDRSPRPPAADYPEKTFARQGFGKVRAFEICTGSVTSRGFFCEAGRLLPGSYLSRDERVAIEDVPQRSVLRLGDPDAAGHTNAARAIPIVADP